LTGERTLARSTAPDVSVSCYAKKNKKKKQPCRWGDYAGASPDPIQSNKVWGSNQAQGRVSSKPCTVPGIGGSHPCPSWFTNNFALVIP